MGRRYGGGLPARASVMVDPLAKRGVDPCVPAATAGLEVIRTASSASTRGWRHPAAQLPARPTLTSPSRPVRGQPRLGAHGTVDERDAAGAVPAAWPVGGKRPAVLDQLALDGVRRVVRRLEAGPVGGVEGLDADGAGPVCRVSGALHPPQVRCVPAVSTPAGIRRRGDRS